MNPKSLIVFSSMCCGALVAFAFSPAFDHRHFGWKDADGNWHRSLNQQRRNIEFVHDNHCAVRFERKASDLPEIGYDLEVKRDYGFKMYTCPGYAGSVMIYDYELQP